MVYGMNISLPRQLEEFVQHQVATGQYGSASEVVRTGLRILFEQEQARAERRQLLQDAIRHSLETGGPSVPAAEVDARIRRMLGLSAEGESETAPDREPVAERSVPAMAMRSRQAV